jgi:hypothetical protein
MSVALAWEGSSRQPQEGEGGGLPARGQRHRLPGLGHSGLTDLNRSGSRGHVGHELPQLGGTVRVSDLEEAKLVCDEMARRARQNVEVIVERLSSEGYRFHSNDDAQTPRRSTSRRRSRRESMQIGWRNASARCP